MKRKKIFYLLQNKQKQGDYYNYICMYFKVSRKGRLRLKTTTANPHGLTFKYEIRTDARVVARQRDHL